MNVLGVTLARGGSKGVPGKHTRDLCGKPVIAWTVDAALESGVLDRYVVSSDSAEILEVAWTYGAQPIERPSFLAQDETPTLPALQHAVREAERMYERTFDLIVEIRATSPLKDARDIREIVGWLRRSGADSVIGVVRLDDAHPSRVKQMVGGRLVDWPASPENPSGRRQDCTPAAYLRNGTVYAFKRSAVMGPDARLFGHAHSLGMEMPPERSVNIDTELDFKLCQLLLAERLEHVNAV